MCLHDFLARSLDLMKLLAYIEQRQADIAARLANLEAYGVREPGRAAILARLDSDRCEIGAELDRALLMLSGFAPRAQLQLDEPRTPGTFRELSGLPIAVHARTVFEEDQNVSA